MSYKYAQLGNSCKPQTLGSLTSNTKYIIPDDPVYSKKWTMMLRYPGTENMYGEDQGKLFGESGEPEKVKAFNVTQGTPHNAYNPYNQFGGCKTCRN